MKKVIVFLTLVLFSTISFCETTWTGFLADKMCSKRLTGDATKAAGHSKECLTEDHCAQSGYGVIVDGKWYKFDKNGNDLAAALLKSTNRTNSIKVTVSGTLKKGKISVTNLTEAS